MKRGALVALVVLVVAVCAAGSAAYAFDGAVQVYADSPWGAQNPYNYGGGEFDVSVVSGNLHQFTSVAPGHPGTDFATFCAQEHQNIYPGGVYDVTLAMATDHGMAIPLTAGVAQLFHLWNAGALSGYDYANATYDAGQPEFTTGRRGTAYDLQQVFWQLMYEGAVANGQNWLGPAPSYTGARNQAGWYQFAKTTTSWEGAEGVRIAQLGSDTLNQDIFVETTPEPASLALLAIGALPVLPILRRRRSA